MHRSRWIPNTKYLYDCTDASSWCGQLATLRFAANFVKDWREVVLKAHDNLQQAQLRQKRVYHDKERLAISFKAGDLVLVETKNRATTRLDAWADSRWHSFQFSKTGWWQSRSLLFSNWTCETKYFIRWGFVSCLKKISRNWHHCTVYLNPFRVFCPITTLTIRWKSRF